MKTSRHFGNFDGKHFSNMVTGTVWCQIWQVSNTKAIPVKLATDSKSGDYTVIMLLIVCTKIFLKMLKSLIVSNFKNHK